MHVMPSMRGAGLALIGALGWLCVPKCPLCLAAYVAIGSGVTLTYSHGQALRQLLMVCATGLILLGGWQLVRCGLEWLGTRGIRRRQTAQPV